MTYTLPYRYTPENAGHMPMFDQFLNDCWATDPDYWRCRRWSAFR